jgi:Zn-dependent membrane protease YugP
LPFFPRRCRRACAGAALAWVAIVLAWVAPPGFAADPSAEVIREWIDQLGAEQFADREAASRSLAAVGIAAHEAGHALQDHTGYPLMSLRNAAVGIANIGSGFGLTVFMVGLMFASRPMAWVGIGLFAATVFFQLVNLPVEIDASNRAKRQLVELGIVPGADMPHVNKVLNSAAWTYVAATLQSALTLLYYASYLTGGDRDSEG